MLLNLLSHITRIRIDQQTYFKALYTLNNSAYEGLEKGLSVGYTHVLGLRPYVPDVYGFFDSSTFIIGEKYYEYIKEYL